MALSSAKQKREYCEILFLKKYCLFNNILQRILFCVQQKKVRQVWNDEGEKMMEVLSFFLCNFFIIYFI